MPIISFEKKHKEKKVVYGLVRTGHTTPYGHFAKYGNNSAIYGIKCNTLDKYYIGATKHLQMRLHKHFNLLKFGKHPCKELQKDFNKYGKSDFNIIIYVDNPKDLLDAEMNTQLNLTIDKLYNKVIRNNYIDKNLSKIRASTSKATHKTKEYRQKQSIAKTNRIAQYYLDNELIKVWDSAIQICETLGHTRSVILSACNGNKPKAYGCIWKYVDENNNIIKSGYNKARKI